jgi:hypothetical protein
MQILRGSTDVELMAVVMLVSHAAQKSGHVVLIIVSDA